MRGGGWKRGAAVWFSLGFLLVAGPVLAERGNDPALVTALTGRFPPFSYFAAEGELAGFDVDVTREIARRLGRPARIVATEWDGILSGLLAGKFDAIIGSMAVTPQRAEQVLFSRPYYQSGAQLFVHRDNPGRIYGIDDCAEATIAVVLGETYQHYLESHYPEIRLLTFKSTVEIFEMLEQGRISGFVTDKLVGLWQLKQAGKPFAAVGDLLYSEEIAIPVRRGDTVLLAELDNALAAMEADGTLRRLHDRYFNLSAGERGGAVQTAMRGPVIVGKLLRGFSVTLLVALGALSIGLLLAVPAGMLLAGQAPAWKVPRLGLRLLVNFLRGTPVLIQLLFVWMGLGVSSYVAALLTLGINAMAYMAEVIRAGLLSLPPGQESAAQALGLNSRQRFVHVVWPQAFRVALPPLVNSAIALLKDTALIAVIAIPEVIREAQSIISVTFAPGKYYLVCALLFCAVTLPLMQQAERLEARIKQKGYSHD